MYKHFFITLSMRDALICSLPLILTQLFTHPLVQVTKGANKTHSAWLVLHPTHTVGITLSPAQTFRSLEQRKRQSACPNTKTQAPKQIRSRQGALGEGKEFAASFSFQPLQHPKKHIAKPTQITQLEDEDEQEQWLVQRQTYSSRE